jgi:hypothetical protein
MGPVNGKLTGEPITGKPMSLAPEFLRWDRFF